MPILTKTACLSHISHLWALPNFQEFSEDHYICGPETHFLQMNSHETLVSSYASTKSKIQNMTVGTPDLEFVCPSYEPLKIYD